MYHVDEAPHLVVADWVEKDQHVVELWTVNISGWSPYNHTSGEGGANAPKVQVIQDVKKADPSSGRNIGCRVPGLGATMVTSS